MGNRVGFTVSAVQLRSEDPASNGQNFRSDLGVALSFEMLHIHSHFHRSHNTTFSSVLVYDSVWQSQKAQAE